MCGSGQRLGIAAAVCTIAGQLPFALLRSHSSVLPIPLLRMGINRAVRGTGSHLPWCTNCRNRASRPRRSAECIARGTTSPCRCSASTVRRGEVPRRWLSRALPLARSTPPHYSINCVEVKHVPPEAALSSVSRDDAESAGLSGFRSFACARRAREPSMVGRARLWPCRCDQAVLPLPAALDRRRDGALLHCARRQQAGAGFRLLRG